MPGPRRRYVASVSSGSGSVLNRVLADLDNSVHFFTHMSLFLTVCRRDETCRQDILEFGLSLSLVTVLTYCCLV